MCCSGFSLKPLEVQRTSLPCPDSEPVQEFVFRLSASQLCPHFKAESSLKALQPQELRVCHFCHCWAFFMCVSESCHSVPGAAAPCKMPRACVETVPKLQKQMQTNTSFHQLSARTDFLSDMRLQVYVYSCLLISRSDFCG